MWMGPLHRLGLYMGRASAWTGPLHRLGLYMDWASAWTGPLHRLGLYMDWASAWTGPLHRLGLAWTEPLHRQDLCMDCAFIFTLPGSWLQSWKSLKTLLPSPWRHMTLESTYATTPGERGLSAVVLLWAHRLVALE